MILIGCNKVCGDKQATHGTNDDGRKFMVFHRTKFQINHKRQGEDEEDRMPIAVELLGTTCC